MADKITMTLKNEATGEVFIGEFWLPVNVKVRLAKEDELNESVILELREKVNDHLTTGTRLWVRPKGAYLLEY